MQNMRRVMYAYGFCDGNAVAAVAEYHGRFPNLRIQNRRAFTRVFNILRESGTLPSAPVSSERQGQQHAAEVENILQLVERSAGTSTRRIFMHLGIPHTRVWRTLLDAGLCPWYVQCVQHLESADPAKRLEFCHWLNVNRLLHPSVLFTDEATFTRDDIYNKHNPHRWSQKILMPYWKQFLTLLLCQCVVWHHRLLGEWSGYLRESSYRTNLPRISATYISRTIGGYSFGYTGWYVHSA
jgi:hypothetical protein